MITLKESNGMLHITISGALDFNSSRDVLRKYKTHTEHYQVSKVDILLTQVTSFNSCAIGAFMLLAEKVGDQFTVRLEQCHEGVHQLFDSGLLDPFLKIVRSPSPQEQIPCTNCYASGCRTPVASCEKADFLPQKVYPLLQLCGVGNS